MYRHPGPLESSGRITRRLILESQLPEVASGRLSGIGRFPTLLALARGRSSPSKAKDEQPRSATSPSLLLRPRSKLWNPGGGAPTRGSLLDGFGTGPTQLLGCKAVTCRPVCNPMPCLGFGRLLVIASYCLILRIVLLPLSLTYTVLFAPATIPTGE
jgi:hypothetical protein